MAVTYKDIDLLTQKATIAGTEKIPVSDTEYVTTTQIASLGGGGGSAGTLNTTNTTAQTPAELESLGGTVNLHKVAKTGTYSDLTGTPEVELTPKRDGDSLITSGAVMSYCVLATGMTPTETVEGAYLQRSGNEFSSTSFSYSKYSVTPGEVYAVSSVIGGSGYSAGVHRIAIWLDTNDNVLSYSDETNEANTIVYYRDVPLEVPANATTMVVNFRHNYNMSGVAKKLSKPNPLALLKVAQTLTSSEQAQARTNIGAAAASDIPTVPTNVSAFTNDAGYITGYTETDPTVPSWAKALTKPTYTANEVGALPSTTTLSDLSDDSTHRVVTDTEKNTWNGKQNAITISSSEPTASQGSNGDIWIVV